MTSSNPNPNDPANEDPTARQIEARRQGAAYQGAFEAVVAILIAAGVGYWADTRFDSSPVGLLIGTAIGFGSFVLRLLRLGNQLQEISESEASGGSADSGSTNDRAD
ncbi:MAG: AtpZ/AtpI family protein [Myxococcota bacterium]